MRTLPGMLRIDNLGKRYGDHLVFEGLNHVFQPGCVALCEEENTGKSTLLGIMAGVVTPDAGEVLIGGYSMSRAPEKAKASLAYVPDDCSGNPTQTGRGFLEQIAADKNAILDAAVFDWVGRLGVEPHLDKRFEQMSTGTRRKVFLAAAAVGNPAVVIADGPSNGLDAGARAALAQQFKTWSRDRVVLFASHDHDLVQACAAKVIKVASLR